MNLTHCERIFGVQNFSSLENLLEAARLSCEKDLRVITETDNPSVIYKIPNFCITDPAVERDYQMIKEKYEGVESEPLTIKCFCFTNLKEIQMEVTNRTTGKEVKEKFAKEENFPLEKFSIRLFFGLQKKFNLLIFTINH